MIRGDALALQAGLGEHQHLALDWDVQLAQQREHDFALALAQFNFPGNHAGLEPADRLVRSSARIIDRWLLIRLALLRSRKFVRENANHSIDQIHKMSHFARSQTLPRGASS